MFKRQNMGVKEENFIKRQNAVKLGEIEGDSAYQNESREGNSN